MQARNALVLGDPEEEWLALFKSLLKKASGLVLTDFLHRAARTIRREIKQDVKLGKDPHWRFTTVYELANHIESLRTECPPAIRCAVVCLSQIGHILVYEEGYPSHLSDGSPLVVAGYGVGSIAAAVFASSTGASERAPSSEIAIALAFLVGSLIQRKIENVAGLSFEGNLPSWALLTLPLAANEAERVLKDFNKQNSLAGHRTCYISSVHAAETVVSGPRSSVEALREQHGIPRIVATYPMHASHLYCEIDLDCLKPLIRASISPQPANGKLPIFLSASGEPLQANSSAELILQSVKSLLLWRRDTVKLSQALAASCSSEECNLFVLAEDGTSRYLAARMASLNGRDSVKIIDICAAGSHTYPQRQPAKPQIAVVGMAGRFPEAADQDRLWELLMAGRDVHRTVPPDRFNYASHSDPTGKKRNTSKSPYGCFINEPGLFDPRFFHMSPKEAAQTDPAQRLMILTAYEALEMAGFVPNRTPSSSQDRVGTFYGQASDDWRETNSSQDIDTYFIPGGIRAFGPGRINYFLKFSGPSYSVDTACSSSFAAIHMACNSLLAGDCDTAIAGGANILTNPDIFAGLSSGHFLSPNGPCKTFDANADGYCRGDGVGSVILKRLDDAEHDNDNILGIIVGVGTNHSADAVSITHPHAPSQAMLYQSILSNNGVNAHDVDYVEMHGTGTAAGDYNEMLSVSDVFASRQGPRRPQPLYVSSVKANIGHGEAAAGISSLIKVLMMLRNSAIPPHVGIKGTVNPSFPQDLEARNVHIPFVGTSWLPKADTPRVAFLNNFSAAGGNTALLLKEYRPHPVKREQHPRSTHIISVSAKTSRSMQMNLERLATFIQENPNTNIADLSYTLTSRRVAHDYRKTFAASQLAEVRNILLSGAAQSIDPVALRPPRMIFAFTGQGSLYSSLAQTLFESCTRFRRDILELDSIATAQGLPSFLELIDGSAVDVTSLSPVISQVGQVCVQVALARLWISWGIQPSAVVGHSLGEYPALAMAGVLSTCDMIYLVGRRAQLFQELAVTNSHGMLAVNANVESLLHRTSGTTVEVACSNAPNMTVLGGAREALQDCARSLQADGVRFTWLPVTHAYHTAQVDVILTEFRQSAEHLVYSPPQLPVLSPLLSSIVEVGSNVLNADYLCRQAREMVNFQGALSSIRDKSEWTYNAIWLEVGPHPTCTKFVEQTLGPAASVVKSLYRGHDPWKTMSESLCSLHERGLAVDWEQYHHGFEDYHTLIDLPAYAWELKNFWIDYRNDWALTKGDAVQVAKETSIASALPRLATTTVHRIVEEKADSGTVSLITETDFSDPYLANIAAGHRVNGVSLCPSSLYADMALTVAKYIYRVIYPNQPTPAIDVYDMHVSKPFILDQRNDVLFRISATANKQGGQLQFYTVHRRDQSKRTDHAACEIQFDEFKKWSTKWARKSYLIEERLVALDAASAAGKAHRIQRGLVYKLFSSFVDYNADYQGIEELVLDSPRFEASARVVLKPTEQGSVYEFPPTWIDSFCHLSGAILNASDAMDSKKFVFISHGWKSLRLLEGLKTGISYRTYTRMQETDEDIMEGDVWIFNGSKVVGLAKGIKFQRIPRKVIDVLLPQPGSHPVVTRAESESTTPQIQGDQAAMSQSLQSFTPGSSPAPSTRPERSSLDLVLEIISSECSVDLTDLADRCTFASLGIDSLLSLEILAKLRESLGIHLRPDVFLETETVGDLKTQLLDMFADATNSEGQKVAIPTSFSHNRTATLTPVASSNVSVEHELLERDLFQSRTPFSSPPTGAYSETSTPAPGDISSPKAVSYLMSGNPRTATKYLFLFPDGSGSATSYASLLPLGSDVAVFALNCPFMTTPSSWKGGIATVIKCYLDEIRRRQPGGSYNFGGWSAGGILAYEAACQVQKAGGKVDRLILIDSPCPVSLPPMPTKMFVFLDSIGLLGSGNVTGTPDWVIPHFEATVRNLDMYLPLPILLGQEPITTTIWARHGVASANAGRRPPRSPEDPKIMEWLLEDRTDFQYNGWDSLVPAGAIRCEVMDGHHFSMTNEHAPELSQLMAKAMS